MACNNSPSLCSRQYNNVTHLGAHDSPFVRDASTGYTTSGNQFYNSSVQLSAGVRLLTAQLQRTNTTSTGQLHLCHTDCGLLDAGKLSDWLGDVKSWMDSNPNNVVTILLVNGADASASDIAAEYQEAGIVDYSYTPSSSSATRNWPTLQSMINNGTRLLNFVASISDNSAAPYLMNEFNYIFENNYDVTDLSGFSCTADRPSSVQANTAGAIYSGMMPLMNHFKYEAQAFGIQSPDEQNITITNAPGNSTGNLGFSAANCTEVYGQAPTFVLVDFFNVGPAIQTIDKLNGVVTPVGRTSVPTTVLSQTSGAMSSNPVSGMFGATLALTLLIFAV